MIACCGGARRRPDRLLLHRPSTAVSQTLRLPSELVVTFRIVLFIHLCDTHSRLLVPLSPVNKIILSLPFSSPARVVYTIVVAALFSLRLSSEDWIKRDLGFLQG